MDTLLKWAPFGVVTFLSGLTQLIDLFNGMSPSRAYEQDKQSIKNFSLIVLGCCGLMQIARGDYKTLGTITFVTALMQFMNKYDYSEMSRWPVVIAIGLLTYMNL